MKEFNITRYSSIEIGSLRLPICISIDKIMDDYFYEIPEYETTKRDIIALEGKDVLIEDQVNSDFFYGKFKDILRISKVLKIIYSFIDNESLKIANINALIFSESEFISTIINTSGVTQKDILNTFYIILSFIKDIKNEFRENAIKLLELLKEFPEIPKGQDDDKYKIPKQYLEFLQYSQSMVSMKTCMDYNGDVYFHENVGKAFEDYSWREKELRKIYDTNKSKIDGFTEAVKGFVQRNAMKS